MKPRTRFDLGCAGLMLLAAALFWALLISIAEASGDCRDGSCNGGDASAESMATAHGGMSTNSNNIEGDKHSAWAVGLNNSLGDVAIADCLASTQWGTPIFSKQKVQLNRWCVAEVYDSKGLYDLAARMRCQIEDIRGLFDDRDSCIVSNTVKPREPSSTAVNRLSTAIAVQSEQQEALIADLRDEIATLRSEVEEQRSRAQRPQTRPQTIIQPQPFLTDEKRAALAAIRGE